jgi:hypothetical protein
MKKLLLFMCMTFALVNANAFEGVIKYRTFRNASEELLALQPLTINGENTFTMVIKGDKMMMNDDRKGTLSILSDGIMTEYCPEDNTGYSCPWIDPTSSALMQFPGTATDQTREMLGETATKYVCEKNANVGMEINGWIIPNSFGFSDQVMKTLNSMINAPGILAKWTMNIGAPYPSSFVSEIIEITPREVADSEFDVIPTNAKIEVVKNWDKYKFHDSQTKAAAKFVKGEMKNVLKMGDLTNSFLKSHPIKPSKVDAVSYDIDEDWDF